MKAFLLITTAVVALGAGPAFAAGAKTMPSGSAMMSMPAANMTMDYKPPAALPGGCPHNAPMCGGLVAAPDGRLVKPPRLQQDAREQPVTQQLNLEAQQLAGVGSAPPPQFGALPPARPMAPAMGY